MEASATPTERLFIAITLPEPVRATLAALSRPIAGLNWTPAQQLHLTLRFLGDVPTERVEPLLERLARVQVEPFILPLEGLGTFPPNRPPRIVWIGTGSGHPRLFQLRQQIDDAVLQVGIDLDVRTFHPHVTLARCQENVGLALSHWMHDHREFNAPPIRVDAFDLYASELRSTGAVHTVKRHFSLERSAPARS